MSPHTQGLRTLVQSVVKHPQCLRQQRLEAVLRTRASIHGQTRQLTKNSIQARSSRRPRVYDAAFTPIQWQALQRRMRSDVKPTTFRQLFVSLFRESPWVMTLWAVMMVSISICIGGIVWWYFVYIKGEFAKYPEPVAKELRKALWYTQDNGSYGQIHPQQAVKYFMRALKKAKELEIDDFSDEIIGIKVRLAQFMEECQFYDKAIDILEIIKRDNLEWMRRNGEKPERCAQRTNVLGKAVGASVKLGELYGNRYINDKEMAEENLVWALETVLKEQRRREQEGVKEGEGEWMSPEETGGTFEALGNHYEEQNQHWLSSPLFIQALALSPAKSCHTAVLMNNLSISLAQQRTPPDEPAASREVLISNAKAWAEKAISLTAGIAPPDRTEECDIGCAVATHNLGEFAEMSKDIAEARKRFEEAKSLAKAIGFEEGVKNAEQGLKRIVSKS